ncbi:MAG: hypothetical protein K2X82_15025 [Gemmataceae bacterium]|nr:hypothetical protein [Gemmataceae bacterium]
MSAAGWGDGWFRADPAGLPRGVVVADATAAAAPLWDGPVLSVLEELAEQVPPAEQPEVAFLGGRELHPLAEVVRAIASGEARRQLGRYPVAGPVLWDLLRGPPRPVLFVLAGPPADLADWDVPEVTARAAVYRLTGPGRVSPPGFTEYGPADDLAAAVAHLRDPVRTVRVGSPAFALDWEGDARWEAGVLTADGPGGVTARLLHPEGGMPEAVFVRASGAEHRRTMTPTDGPPAIAALGLTPAEGVVLDVWRAGHPYHCGACRRSHPPGQVGCRPPAPAGGLFPTLAEGMPSVHVAVRGPGGWAVTPVPRGIVPLPDGTVLVRRPGAAPGYEWDGAGWVPLADDPGGFVPVADGAYILAGPAEERGA